MNLMKSQISHDPTPNPTPKTFSKSTSGQRTCTCSVCFLPFDFVVLPLAIFGVVVFLERSVYFDGTSENCIIVGKTDVAYFVPISP